MPQIDTEYYFFIVYINLEVYSLKNGQASLLEY